MTRWPGYVRWRTPRAYGSYVQKYPTHYDWIARVRRRCLYLVRHFAVSVNTYWKHPPPTRKFEFLSIDVWGRPGRGYHLPTKTGRRVWRFLWTYGPRWNWGIYQGRMWSRGRGWSASPPGPRDSDPGHYRHLHVTFL